MRLVCPLILKCWIVLCIRMLLVWVSDNLDVWGCLSPKIRFLVHVIQCDLLLLPTKYCWRQEMIIRTNCGWEIQLVVGLRLWVVPLDNILGTGVVLGTKWCFLLVHLLVDRVVVFYRLFCSRLDPLDRGGFPKLQPWCLCYCRIAFLWSIYRDRSIHLCEVILLVTDVDIFCATVCRSVLCLWPVLLSIRDVLCLCSFCGSIYPWRLVVCL